MAPVVRALRMFPDRLKTVLVSTGQHKEILLQALAAFDLVPDVDLAIMTHGQTLAKITSRSIDGLDDQFARLEPAMVLAQGDTTTVFAASVCSFYRRIPFGHVEAGLRTTEIDNPFPEEYNRRAAGLVATLHLAPTGWARDNLLKEGKDPSRVFVTGNTGIDAVLHTAKRVQEAWFADHPGRVVVLTTHRRENWGEPQRQIARAARRIVEAFDDVLLVVPMHPNPGVREVLIAELGGHPRIQLIEPPEYGRFVKLTQRATLVLTDSGGVQEEAPAFGVPVLVLRTTTERPEGVDAGTARLVGADGEQIWREASMLLSDDEAYAQMAKSVSPYGDGKAAERVRYLVTRELSIDTPEVSLWQ